MVRELSPGEAGRDGGAPRGAARAVPAAPCPPRLRRRRAAGRGGERERGAGEAEGYCVRRPEPGGRRRAGERASGGGFWLALRE